MVAGVGLGFRVRGCRGKAPSPAGPDERLAAAVGAAAAADRAWLGEAPWASLPG
jgi:hypothetical protein